VATQKLCFSSQWCRGVGQGVIGYSFKAICNLKPVLLLMVIFLVPGIFDSNLTLSKILFSVGIKAAGVTVTTMNSELKKGFYIFRL
jgi:hypothetical protein